MFFTGNLKKKQKKNKTLLPQCRLLFFIENSKFDTFYVLILLTVDTRTLLYMLLGLLGWSSEDYHDHTYIVVCSFMQLGGYTCMNNHLIEYIAGII